MLAASSITLWIDPQWAPGIANDRAGSGRGGSPILPPDGSGLSGWRPIESAAPAWLSVSFDELVEQMVKHDRKLVMMQSAVGAANASSSRFAMLNSYGEKPKRQLACHDHLCSAGRIAAKPDIATARYDQEEFKVFARCGDHCRHLRTRFGSRRLLLLLARRETISRCECCRQTGPFTKSMIARTLCHESKPRINIRRL